MRITADRLYELLPAIYRIRDFELGGTAQGPLRALVEVIAEQGIAMEDNIADLYRNWFIETCDEWVVPYLGDLLGAGTPYSVSSGTFSRRGYVANTITYRRRKGAASMLEALARDLTGLPARAVEFFSLLATTQHLNHLRPANVRTPDLRRTARLEKLKGPFDDVPRTVDVRRIEPGRGRHNIPSVGIFLWRLQSYPTERAEARALDSPPNGRFTFHPLGIDANLFNAPRTEAEITHIAEERDVPAPLRRRPLFDELEALRRSLVDGTPAGAVWFDGSPVLRIFVPEDPNDPTGETVEIHPSQISICDLTGWEIPSGTRTYRPADGGDPQALPIRVAVDPVLGRMTFPAASQPERVEVSYSYGFSGDLGGGPYKRDDDEAPPTVGWRFTVRQGASLSATEGPTLADAVQAWNGLPAGTIGVVTVVDSGTYLESLTGAGAVVIPPGSSLTVESAPGELPLLSGSIEILGGPVSPNVVAGGITIAGLIVEGSITVLPGHLGELRIEHCTLPPTGESIVARGTAAPGTGNDDLAVTVKRTLCGRITLVESATRLVVTDSIVGIATAVPGDPPAIDASGSEVAITASTIHGGCSARTLDGSNAIFTGRVEAERRQTGCLRFSVLPQDSRTPRRYRCQPETALFERATALGLNSLQDLPAIESARIIARLRPCFTSLRYGDASYGQLDLSCAVEIRTGADDGSEMGAFHFLQGPQRDANLRTSLREYLRFGFEAGIVYVT